MGLCFRCEHRAIFLEDGHAPRSECGEVELSINNCYMYIPTKPCITVPLDSDRPRFSSPMVSSREEFHRIPGAHEVKLTANKLHNNEAILLYEKVEK